MDSKSYERMVQQQENDKLAYYTERANSEQNQQEEDTLFINMSIQQIFQRMAQTFVDIINELVSGEVTDLRGLVVTFFSKDRMVYVGTLLVMIAFAIYIMDISS